MVDTRSKPSSPAASWRTDQKSSSERGYNYRWQKARETFLKQHPLCRLHAALGHVVLATVVDHIEPHRGDQSKFWNRANWQPLCKACHDSTKQRAEKSGVLQGCGLSGVPLDPNHHWAKALRQREEGG